VIYGAALSIAAVATGPVNAQQALDTDRARETVERIRGQARGGSGVQGCGVGTDGEERGYAINPSLGARETITNNAGLDPEGDEESALITTVTPGLRACASGTRLRGSLNYGADASVNHSDSDGNNVTHELDATGRGVVIDDQFFVDARASRRQQIVDSREAFSGDNALDTGNRTDRTSVSLSPTWEQRLGRIGRGRVRLSHQRSYTDTDRGNTVSGDSRSNTYSASLNSPTGNLDWSWSFLVTEERLERQGRDDPQYFGRARAELGRRIYGGLFLTGQGGLEHDQSDGLDADRFASTFWNVGLRWQSARTQAEFRVGERFFGTSFQGSLTHVGPRLTTRISYSETPQQRERRDVLLRSPLLGTLDVTREEVFIEKRLEASAVYELPRTSITLTAFSDDREFLRADNDEQSRGLTLRVDWQFLPRTRLTPEINWEQRDFTDGRDDTTQRYEISLRHSLSRTLTARATSRHQFRDSDDAVNEYTESALIIGLNKSF
jgi:hypothetical protein